MALMRRKCSSAVIGLVAAAITFLPAATAAQSQTGDTVKADTAKPNAGQSRRIQLKAGNIMQQLMEQMGQQPQAAHSLATDLVGQWANLGAKTPHLILNADSTFAWPHKGMALSVGGSKVKYSLMGRWHLAGDTLKFSNVLYKAEGSVQGAPGAIPATIVDHLVKLDGNRLTYIDSPVKKPRSDKGLYVTSPDSVVLERFNAATP